MPYKRYIFRKGKKLGPYYYSSYRDKDGKIQKKYHGKKLEHEEMFSTKSLTAFLLTVITFAFAFIIDMIAIEPKSKSQNILDSALYSAKPGNEILWFILIVVLLGLIFIVIYSIIHHVIKIVGPKKNKKKSIK